MTNAISIIDLAHKGPFLYAIKRDDGRAITTIMEGPPGIAKTAIINGPLREILAKAFKCTVSVVTDILSQRDPMDIRGVLIPYKREDGTPAAAYTLADLAVRVQKSPGYKDGIVILFLDELFQADALTQKAIAEVLHTGKLGEFQLPPNVWIIGASNRQQDAAGVNRVLSHVGNRVRRYEVVLPNDNWINWAANAGLPAIVRSFADFRKDLFAQEVPRDGKPFMTYRTLTDAALAIQEDKRSRGDTNEMTLDVQDLFLRSTIEGSIGEAATHELYGFAKFANELPTPREIIADPMAARLPMPSQIGAQYAAMGLLSSMADEHNISQCWKYATRLVRDFQAVLLKNLTDKSFGGVLLNCPEIGQWVSDPANKSLLVGTYSRQ